MNNIHAPSIGLVELPGLGEVLRQLGFRVISGGSFPEAASAVKTTIETAQASADATGEAVAAFPTLIADVHRPGIKAWSQKLSRTSPVLILRTDADDYIVAEGARSLQLPASVRQILLTAGLTAPDDVRSDLVIDAAGAVVNGQQSVAPTATRSAPDAPTPAPAAAEVVPTEPAWDAAATFGSPAAQPATPAPVYQPPAATYQSPAATYQPPAPAPAPTYQPPAAPTYQAPAASAPAEQMRAPWAQAPTDEAPAPETVAAYEAPADHTFERVEQTLFPDPEPEVVSAPISARQHVNAPIAATTPVPTFTDDWDVLESAVDVAPPAPSAAGAWENLPAPGAPMPADSWDNIPPPPSMSQDAAPAVTAPTEYQAPATPAWEATPASDAPAPASPAWDDSPVYVAPAAPAAPSWEAAAVPGHAPDLAPTSAPPAWDATPPYVAPAPAAPAWDATPTHVAPAPVTPAWDAPPTQPAAPAAEQTSYTSPPFSERPTAPVYEAPTVVPAWKSAPSAPVAPASVKPVPEYRDANLYDNAAGQVSWAPEYVPEVVPNVGGAPVIFNWAYKGGVNKTSLSLQLAHRAADKGLRVWLIDMNRGQGGIRTMLRIADDAPVRSAFDAARYGDPAKAFVLPDEAQRHRGSQLEPLKFGIVLAPPRAEADPGQATYMVYRQIIDHARANGDLVIVDTQTIEATDTSGLINNVMLPMMVADAYGVGITEFGKESVDNLRFAFGMFAGRGLRRDRQMLVVTRVKTFTDVDAQGVDRKFHDFANFVGTTAHSEGIKDQLDRGRIVSDDPAVRPLLDVVLRNVTGESRFDPVFHAGEPEKPRRRMFGGGRK